MASGHRIEQISTETKLPVCGNNLHAFCQKTGAKWWIREDREGNFYFTIFVLSLRGSNRKYIQYFESFKTNWAPAFFEFFVLNLKLY